MATNFHLKVITPEKTFFDGETELLTLKTTEGDKGIMAHHENYVAILPSGALKIKVGGESKIAALAQGFVKVEKDRTTVIATAVEWADEIDIAHARRSEEDARRRIEEKRSQHDLDRAELKLKRALNRISISSGA